MQMSSRLATLGSGTLFFVISAGAAVPGSNLDALAARLKGADAAGRRQIIRSLSEVERRQLRVEYRALSPEGKQVVDAALGRNRKPGDKTRAPLGTVGTVQYDTGSPHFIPDNTNDVVGNQFNTGFGNPHNISWVTFFPTAGTFGFYQMRLYGAPVGTVAPVLASTTLSTAPGGVGMWDLRPDIINHSGSFLVGMKQSGVSNFPAPSVVAILVDINNGGQGFHGMNIKLNGSGFVPNATVGGAPYNAIVRVSGINLPVELMNFDVQ